MDKNNWLDQALADDDLGLLDIKPISVAPTADEHLLAGFTEINAFVSQYQREPEKTISNMTEFQLHARLASIRGNPLHRATLVEYDTHGLFFEITQGAETTPDCIPDQSAALEQEKVFASLEDVFADDSFGLLNTEQNSIFDITHIPKERIKADDISRRKKCKDFDQYKDKFKQVQQEIGDNKRMLKLFTDKGQALVEGNFYIMHGILLYLKSIDISSEEKTVGGKRFRKDGRTHCIFENGTESNMLYRSLAKELYKDGKIVSQTNEATTQETYDNFHGINKDDTETGYVYILKSLSDNPEIAFRKDLYKIGLCSSSVEKRIANAENEATYLMAPVKIIASYKCFNTNIQELEGLIHQFFGSTCLDIEVTDQNGQIHRPREWFLTPFNNIDSAIQLLISGDIVNYRYDNATKAIIER